MSKIEIVSSFHLNRDGRTEAVVQPRASYLTTDEAFLKSHLHVTNHTWLCLTGQREDPCLFDTVAVLWYYRFDDRKVLLGIGSLEDIEILQQTYQQHLL